MGDMRWAYGVLSANKLDTSGMKPAEVLRKANELLKMKPKSEMQKGGKS